MNLLGRIERLENARGYTSEDLPEVHIQFIEPVHEPRKGMRPGRCTGGLRLLSGGGQQWLDADMNPIEKPA